MPDTLELARIFEKHFAELTGITDCRVTITHNTPAITVSMTNELMADYPGGRTAVKEQAMRALHSVETHYRLTTGRNVAFGVAVIVKDRTWGFYGGTRARTAANK